MGVIRKQNKNTSPLGPADRPHSDMDEIYLYTAVRPHGHSRQMRCRTEKR